MSDVEELTRAALESVEHMTPWMPWCHAGYALDDAVNWVRTTQEGRSNGSMYDFAIMDAAGRYAGGCGLNQINRESGTANLGYWVRASSARRGVAPAAVLQLVGWAFDNTPLQRLEIVVALGNVRSLRVAEKVGAHRDAVLRKRLLLEGAPVDAVLYSVVRPD
jgi:RimJ/RimL family protein N-acetyltransferase